MPVIIQYVFILLNKHTGKPTKLLSHIYLFERTIYSVTLVGGKYWILYTIGENIRDKDITETIFTTFIKIHFYSPTYI